jgi:hypothetical protein
MTSNDRIVEAVSKGYRIENGKPISPTGEVLAVNRDRGGYWRFSVLGSDGKVRPLMVHRVVAYQKYGKGLFAPGIQVRHANGNQSDNSFENILIGTQSDNEMDKPDEIRKTVARNAARKLTEEQVCQLRKDRESGMKYDALVQKYGIRKSTVSYIVNGKTY